MSTDPGNADTVLLGDATVTEHEMVIRLERLRVQEALNARDNAVKRLALACASVRETTDALNALREEKEQLQKRFNIGGPGSDKENEGIAGSENEVEVGKLMESLSVMESRWTSSNGTKNDVENVSKVIGHASSGIRVLSDVSNAGSSVSLSSPFSVCVTPKDVEASDSPWTPLEGEKTVALPTVNTVEKIEARYGVLASLPVPSAIPEDSLTPILIPAPYSLHDFIGTTAGVSVVGHFEAKLMKRNSYSSYDPSNYRVFQQSTTTWCPEREEHGYYLTPIFKCSTNPRVTTAHRWSVVDISAKLDKPTECFFNKDGKWYYAGIYKSFRLEDLCTQEWECLSPETSHALIKETLAARKNTSPQNIYETAQLYSAGALKVACIGLQCIGFNTTLYRGLLDHAALCTQTGGWRMPTGGYGAGLGLALVSDVPRNVSATVPASGPGSPVAAPMRSVRSLTPTARLAQNGTHDVLATSGMLGT